MKIVFTIFFLSLLFFQETLFSEEIKALEDVVVTATKVPTPTEQLGASIKIITSDDIEKSGAISLSDVLRKVAGLNIVQSGSRGSMTSLFVRGGESDYNLVMIDGIQLNQPGGAYDFSDLTTENIERIEIIKGAHSALHGSNAIASVINIITKRGSGKPSLLLSGAVGVRDEDNHLIQEYVSSVSGGDKRYGYFLSYGRVDDEGALDINNEYKNDNFTGTLNFNPNEQIKTAFTAIFQDSKFEFPTDGSTGDRGALDPDQFQKEKNVVIGGNLSYSPKDWWENVVALGFARERRDFVDDPNKEICPEGTAGQFCELGSRSKVEEERFTFEYRANFFLDFFDFENITTVTTVGFEFEDESADDGIVDRSRTNYAYYTQKQIGFFERFFVTKSFRIDDNEQFGVEITQRVSAAYLLSEYGTKIRGGFGRGIKEPTFFENFGGFGLIGNGNLDPEESLSIEGGIDQKLFNNRAKLYFTYFWNKYENLIEFSFAEFPNGTNFENINQAKTKGVEVGGSFDFGYGATLEVNYTFLDTEVMDDGGLGSAGSQFFEGANLIRRPKHTFNFVVNYLIMGLNLNLSGRYIGETEDIDFVNSVRVNNESYFVADLAASYSLPITSPYLKNAKLFTRVNNLFNEDYEEVFAFSTPGFSVVSGLALEIGS